ncbi:hypothetical protein BACCIP111883_03567 [Sutcliffiella rhizosphaerae]|uniref:Uncharacterized protein n=1 Tax=Sutcliffiella rhizosphaerae TaxID=2880967 RepID=A0ABN8AFC3_9BACI|nr:hypothetical protein BACCIP111883_03567 [Sutcliffiella rhizosphaerae]
MHLPLNEIELRKLEKELAVILKKNTSTKLSVLKIEDSKNFAKTLFKYLK